jgi:hypothetical protein
MLTENEKKEYVKQANIRRRTIQPGSFKKTIGKWNEKHPNYLKDYLKEWRKKHPNYMKEWKAIHPNYMQDYLKEWKRNTKRINVGSTLKIEGVDLAVVSEPDKNIYREIDELMKDELVSRRDER